MAEEDYNEVDDLGYEDEPVEPEIEDGVEEDADIKENDDINGEPMETEDKAETEPVQRLRRTSKFMTKKPTKGRKAAKDPNKSFRETYKKEHPKNKSVAAVCKAGGEKWKTMSDSEKAPYVAMADKRKVEYEKNIKAYNKKLVCLQWVRRREE